MAKLNAVRNGITNTKFFAGKAEDVISIPEFQKPEIADDVVAIVDPPRAGLRKYNPKLVQLVIMKYFIIIHMI